MYQISVRNEKQRDETTQFMETRDAEREMREEEERRRLPSSAMIVVAKWRRRKKERVDLRMVAERGI
ncbi:uncharacterized protein G2W53_002764 [Senna tora]|uniref:Uncharacterized protein n=1 Tax=Senna tora TaxID=362788 RepID=A0A835CGA6_9FABA|nr:uncharacterized protein G2W53_002764 [Senna tora]